jgi:hypothetical protein
LPLKIIKNDELNCYHSRLSHTPFNYALYPGNIFFKWKDFLSSQTLPLLTVKNSMLDVSFTEEPKNYPLSFIESTKQRTPEFSRLKKRYHGIWNPNDERRGGISLEGTTADDVNSIEDALCDVKGYFTIAHNVKNYMFTNFVPRPFHNLWHWKKICNVKACNQQLNKVMNLSATKVLTYGTAPRYEFCFRRPTTSLTDTTVRDLFDYDAVTQYFNNLLTDTTSGDCRTFQEHFGVELVSK